MHMHCSCTACALHVHCQATVEHVASSAAVATGLAMLPDGFTGTSSGSGHSPGSEVRPVDEGKTAADEGGARSVPPRRPCSVGWRGATVLCTRALRDAEWARLTAEYRDTQASSCGASGARSAAAIEAVEPLQP